VSLSKLVKISFTGPGV